MTFNIENFNNFLKQQQLNKGEFSNIKVHTFDKIPSTNTTIWELIEKGEKTPLVAIAAQQTAGRGQWGRKWISKANGLYLSVGLSPNIKVENGIHLIMATAVGIVENLRKYQIRVELKWLNDLLLNNQKLGGIKIDSKVENNYLKKVAIGVGINWQNEVNYPAINLESFFQKENINSITSLEELSAITISGVLFGYKKYLTEGIENILLTYLKYLNSMGKSININGVKGFITGVNSKGELKVRLSSLNATTEICIPHGTISIGYD